MAATTPGIPKGTRDFGPREMLRRKWIFNTIEEVFKLHGFLPLETPAMEKLQTLTGKYGEEGDRLIFKVLDNGDLWKDLDPSVKDPLVRGEAVAPARFAAAISGKALRYDLTVPFARYVVQHQSEITFPFKRYQIQPVWRADRPQKGRYREFHQCDADVIGSTGLFNEVELIEVIDEVFSRLSVPVLIKVNDRKVLAGIAEVSGQPEKVAGMVMAIDKLEKIGRAKVEEEMRANGVSTEAIERIAPLFAMDGTWAQQAPRLREWLRPSTTAMRGLDDLSRILDGANDLRARIQYDPTLARGLDYYTGAIFEVKAAEGSLQSSICGGGRYDDLTGVFGLKGMSGVGISFGADRIHDVLLELDRFPRDLATSTRVLFVNFGGNEASHCLKLARACREAGISAEVYPDADKMKKQLGYADAKGIPFVALIGGNELKQGIVTIKDMKSGEQKAVKEDELIASLKS